MYCMENLGKRYVESEAVIDSEYVFYKNFLEKYLNESDSGLVAATESDMKCFNEYHLKFSAADVDDKQGDELYNSFMFFISNKTIILKGGMYFINLAKIKEYFDKSEKLDLNKNVYQIKK